MSEKDVFRFEVSSPKREINNDGQYYNMHIVMSAPHFVFCIGIEDDPKYHDLSKRVGMAELKIKMIEALVNGVWEFEDSACFA